MTFEIVIAAIILLSYLTGSIPFGVLLTRAAGLGDIRAIGSGNIGATNVLRTGNKKLAFLTFLLDGLKAVAAITCAQLLAPETVCVAGFAAFIGHLFPIWLKFKGGKGVATYIGACFGFAWPLGLGCIGIWLMIALIFRISSLSALIMLVLLPAIAAYVYNADLAFTLSLMSAISIMRHNDNIKRLLRGEESRITLKK